MKMIGLWVTLGVIGGYVSLSTLFLRFPTLIHKKKKQKFKCRHISHRGGAGECLENTMGAFQNALENGTEMFELDVQLTLDGEVVICHDNDLQRLTGHDILISETNFEDLPILRGTLGVTASPGTTCVCTNGDRSIPKLRSFFEKFKDTPINMDIKTGEKELAERTLEIICEYNMQDKVVMGSFSSVPGKYIRKKYPEISLFCSASRLALIYVLFYTGLLPFVPLKESFFEIPYLPALAGFIPWSGCKLLLFKFVAWLSVSPVLFRHLQRRGFQVYMFILNEVQDYETCFEKLHVDGIMTDYPKKLHAYLSGNRHADMSETTPINGDSGN